MGPALSPLTGGSSALAVPIPLRSLIDWRIVSPKHDRSRRDERGVPCFVWGISRLVIVVGHLSVSESRHASAVFVQSRGLGPRQKQGGQLDHGEQDKWVLPGLPVRAQLRRVRAARPHLEVPTATGSAQLW
jgi:hypothetical protein